MSEDDEKKVYEAALTSPGPVGSDFFVESFVGGYAPLVTVTVEIAEGKIVLNLTPDRAAELAQELAAAAKACGS